MASSVPSFSMIPLTCRDGEATRRELTGGERVATLVLAHGAWSAAWAWKKMRPLLRARGHELYAPTLTGLGERGHHASPAVDLETHISDVVAVLDYEDLRDVVLIGHSYGGMVATGVADRVPERLRQLVYLDAFVPTEGQCLLDYLPKEFRAHLVANAAEGWRVTANPIPPDTSPEDVAWIEPRRMTQPLATFQQPLRLKHGETTLRAATSTAGSPRSAIPSGNSPSGRSGRAGPISSWTRATARTSPRPRPSPTCWRGSLRRPALEVGALERDLVPREGEDVAAVDLHLLPVGGGGGEEPLRPP